MNLKLIGGLAIAALAAGGFLLSESRTQAYDLTPAQLSNLDALSNGEYGDCHYINGYTSFLAEAGGAYDCCNRWVGQRPTTSFPDCK